jgi:hypothetical protein
LTLIPEDTNISKISDNETIIMKFGTEIIFLRVFGEKNL